MSIFFLILFFKQKILCNVIFNAGTIRESSSSPESPNSQDDEDITDVKITDCTYVKSTDSGISLITTSSQDSTEKRIQDESPLRTITPFRDEQVAFVFPTPHDSGN